MTVILMIIIIALGLAALYCAACRLWEDIGPVGCSAVALFIIIIVGLWLGMR